MKLLTVAQVSEKLGVSRQRVFQYIKAGDLIAEKVGSVYLILESNLKQFKPRPSGRPRKDES